MSSRTPVSKKKGFFRKNFDFKQWMGVEGTRDRWRMTWNLVSKTFLVQKATRQENFTEAQHRFALSEEQLEKKRKQFLSLSAFFTFFALGVLAWSVVLIQEHRSYFSSLAAFAIALALGAYAFRFHFWAFMIRKRKLGCTFKEWCHESFKI